MSILEFIAQRGKPSRIEIGRSFSMKRLAENIDRELGWLVMQGLIERCQTCEDLRYSITEKGKEALPK